MHMECHLSYLQYRESITSWYIARRDISIYDRYLIFPVHLDRGDYLTRRMQLLR